MSVSDEQIGRNLTRARGEMSQKELADRMREYGWKWSQATVWSVEKGERPLRLAEAEDLASILEVFAHVFSMDESASKLQERMRVVSGLNRQFEKMVGDYGHALFELALVADDYEDMPSGLREGVEDWLRNTPSRILNDLTVADLFRAEAEHKIMLADGIISAERDAELRAAADERRGHFQKLLEQALEADDQP